jgi:CRISPR type I-E-associated protein CasB/Cse2
MTSTESKPATATGLFNTVQDVVGRKIAGLQQGYRANQSAQVAALARLRRGLGKQPGELLDILEFTTAPELVGDWRSDDPNHAEIAAHHCLTLFAMHQQSQSQPMHHSGQRLGKALRKLIGRDELKPENPVVRRFAMLGTADTLDEVVHHLRGLVQLLRANAIPLDYGLLARDLLAWQYPNGPARVRMGWGRDFYTFTAAEN